MDCADGSDEEECRLVLPSIGHNKFLTPPPLPGDKYLYVNVSYDFKDILYIDENENFIRITYSIQKEWNDRTLTFQNLKKDTMNSIFKDDKSNIWYPWITMINIENKEKEKRANDEEIFKVVPNDEFNFIRSSKTYNQNAFLFKGLIFKALFSSFPSFTIFYFSGFEKLPFAKLELDI